MEFVAMNMLSLLAKTKNRNRSVTVIMDRFSKFTREIWTRRTTAIDVAKIFLRAREMQYGIPYRQLTNNGPLFAGKALKGACVALFT